MASQSAWPVVQPLPKLLVQLAIAVFFVAGHILLWKDRRAVRAQISTGINAGKPVGVPAYK